MSWLEHFFDLTIVLVLGLSAGTIVSTVTWPLFDRGTARRIEGRSQAIVLLGVVLTAIGLIAVAAAPRLQQLKTIPPETWQNAGFGYLFAILWVLPILHGRAAAQQSWVTIGFNWRRGLRYLCLVATILILLIILVQGATAASLLTLLLVGSAVGALSLATRAH